MSTVILALQIIVALGLLNVWLLRFSKNTKYRGGKATNLKEEFTAYGLPTWFMYLIGALKISSALALLAGIWLSSLVVPAAILVVVLMLGALMMHVKVKDPMIKSMPAALMLTMGLVITLTNI
jgi:hypothetical protein